MTAPPEAAAPEWWTMFPRYAHRRGHRLVLYADRRWRWAATGRFVPGGRRPLDQDPPCVGCGLPPTPEGYDACLGHIPGARAACCGHGVKEPYVSWGEGDVERGESVLRLRSHLDRGTRSSSTGLGSVGVRRPDRT